jgi:hypothetical protein
VRPERFERRRALAISCLARGVRRLFLAIATT